MGVQRQGRTPRAMPGLTPTPLLLARPWGGDRRRGGKSASPIRLLPEVSVALPLAVAFLRWELLDTRLGVILASLTMALPVAA